MTSYRDKLQSIGFSRHKGTSRTTNVQHDRTGEVVGSQTEHWNDRVDATAFAPTVNIKTRAEESRD